MKLIQAAAAKIANLEDSTVLSMVDPDQLAEVKKTDPNPRLVAFSIAHEGMSKPNVVGEGPTEIVWNKESVQSMADALPMGTLLYSRHPNYQGEARDSIGRVIGKGTIEASGNLNAVAVAYIPRQHQSEAERADFASIEAEVEFMEPPAGLSEKIKSLFVRAVTAISGIAIGMREKFKPGFPGSQKLASLNAYIYAYEENHPEENPKAMPQINWEELSSREVPWSFIQKLVKERAVHLSDVWNVEEEILPNIELADDGSLAIKGGDRNLAGVVKALDKRIREHSHQRLAKEIGGDPDKVLDEIKSFRAEKHKAELLPKVEEQAKAMGFDEMGIKYLKTQLDPNSVQGDEGLKQFIEREKGRWEQIAGPMKTEPDKQKPTPEEPSQPRVAIRPDNGPSGDVPSWAKGLDDADTTL